MEKTENTPTARTSGKGDFQAERAYDHLVAMLRSGDLRSGQFVSMPGLVELLDFPLAATREAVKRASLNGLLTILPKRGVQLMETGPQTTRHCMDMRAALDMEGARRLIAAGSDLPLDDLSRAHRDTLKAAQGTTDAAISKRAIKTDLTLHALLASGLNNPFLAEAYATNSNRIAIIQHTRPFLPTRISSAMEEHLAIIQALAERDADRAVSAITHHHEQTLLWWGVSS